MRLNERDSKTQMNAERAEKIRHACEGRRSGPGEQLSGTVSLRV